ncbi:50S ribosomal protein L22 [Candidatus Curtissbacteria bacterium RIFCSPLOWO2_01_FULL_38_11b]|uniref:Large ribosomal subunit protein uL22 n=1 Tax=Candidatus Curtissbacteria bacterium RIFCSPLOWO2_01_FULL_38_11b TaxID=1797725 RepID=A0A1F5GZW2_9BACT|nr:MAG: 50S ribosomal protein L22 [Candidatus Curtissbacteria bacterium RIFCSPLOWO2_01_FULL_38_11b]
MEVTATAKNIRVSPNKVRLVVDQIKKMQPNDALRILDFVQKSASLPLKKVIASAIANAKNNHNLKEENLTFTEIQVGLGQVFKRYRPISRGRAHSILKRTSNIRVVLEAKEDKTNTPNKSDVSDKKEPKGGYSGAKS